MFFYSLIILAMQHFLLVKVLVAWYLNRYLENYCLLFIWLCRIAQLFELNTVIAEHGEMALFYLQLCFSIFRAHTRPSEELCHVECTDSGEQLYSLALYVALCSFAVEVVCCAWLCRIAQLFELNTAIAEHGEMALMSGSPNVQGRPPGGWWGENEDRDLLRGVYKHGYGNFDAIRWVFFLKSVVLWCLLLKLTAAIGRYHDMHSFQCPTMLNIRNENVSPYSIT